MCILFRKLIIVLFFVCLNSVVIAAASDCRKKEILCVGLVTDVGTVDDKSFNQSAWEGVQQSAEEIGTVIKYLETRDPKDYMVNISLFAENDYDVVVTVGFGLGEATSQAAKQFSDVKFIGVDQFQANALSNVAGLIFHEDQAGFQAGALAAMLSKSGVIAAVLGTNLVPPVVAFKEGYVSGARYINAKIQVISTYHPGGLAVAFTDPEWGASTAKQAIDQGADVVFGAGGTTGNGGLIEAASHSEKYCIGVDTDQWLTLPAAHPCLVSSATKRIKEGVFQLIQHAKESQFPSGNFFGEVGLSPFHDFDNKIPQYIKEKLTEIHMGLRNGSIKTK